MLLEYVRRQASTLPPLDLAARLARVIEAEQERWLLWLPVAFGSGVALYFALPEEPRWWVALGPLGLSLCALLVWRRQPLALYLTTLLAAAVAGFAAGQLRTAVVSAPLLLERFGPSEVSGTLLMLDRRPSDTRLLIKPGVIEGLSKHELPERVRLRLAGRKKLDARPGDRLQLLAVLLPPPPPAVPGGYDFGRDAFFKEIGAAGFLLGRPEVVARGEASGWMLYWSGLRDDVGLRVREALSPGEAGVAEALLTGQRAGIDPSIQEAYRISGLAHLLAISGLHVGLIAGIFFFSLRALLALAPPIALRWPIKKLAALATALLLPFYLPMVGASVPTQRACLMALIVLAAVLLDRRAISMRLVAFAALVVLAWSPESLLSASFQLSFAAVTALVAAYEVWRARKPDWEREQATLRRLQIYFLGVLLSSLIAGLATAPFAAYHFHRLALYGLLANLLAVPLTAFWIMPLCLLSYLLLPFGLEELAFQPLGWGIAALNSIAVTVADLPGALLTIPAMPLWGLVCLTAGGLWLCLWRSRWRTAGILLLLLGSVSPALQRPADILITGDGRLIGLGAPDGQLWLSNRRVERFAAGIWLRRRAQSEVLVWQQEEQRPWLFCDNLGCRYRHAGLEVALALEAEALREDCSGVALLISLSPIPRGCLAGRPTIDRFDLWRNGTYAVWLSDDAVTLRSVQESRGKRPWSPGRRAADTVFVP